MVILSCGVGHSWWEFTWDSNILSLWTILGKRPPPNIHLPLDCLVTNTWIFLFIQSILVITNESYSSLSQAFSSAKEDNMISMKLSPATEISFPLSFKSTIYHAAPLTIQTWIFSSINRSEQTPQVTTNIGSQGVAMRSRHVESLNYLFWQRSCAYTICWFDFLFDDGKLLGTPQLNG